MNYTLTIPAGKTEGLNCSKADYFCVVLSGVDLHIKIPGKEFELFGQGDSKELREGRTFDRLEIKNPTGGAVVVVMYCGNDRYRQQRQSVIDAPSTSLNVASTIGAHATIDLPGLPTGNQVRRRSLIVSNPDSALDLQILDENNNVIDTVFFRTSAVINNSGHIKVRNDNGSAITASVTEVWFTAGI